MKKLAIASAAAAAVSLLLVSSALAAYSLFGNASIVSPGAGGSPNAAEVTGDPSGSGIRFDVPTGTKFMDLDTLQTDFRMMSGNCQAGSPRFQVRVQNPTTMQAGNVMVYLGTPPNYICGPTPAYVNTGNLLEDTDLIDTSQIGGTFYHPVAVAQTTFGNYNVLSIALVVDPTYGQVVRFDNVNVDGTVYTFDQPQDKDQCKDGGWQMLTRADGTRFRNQGDCVSYFNTGR
jgi:hypothetical protein